MLDLRTQNYDQSWVKFPQLGQLSHNFVRTKINFRNTLVQISGKTNITRTTIPMAKGSAAKQTVANRRVHF